MAQFKTKGGLARMVVPARLRQWGTPPLRLDRSVVGRAELCIGRRGFGKTTWAALRCRRLAKGTGAHRDPGHPTFHAPPGKYRGPWIMDGSDRQLFTTGEGWPEPWICIDSFEALEAVENGVILFDEIHLTLPSMGNLIPAAEIKWWSRWFSLGRKQHVCIVATSQAWTRSATIFRNLVGTVWLCRPVKPGKLHQATAHDPPDEGGAEFWSPQWFDPADASIPTNAGVWVPYADDEAAAPSGRQPAGAPPAGSTPPPLPDWYRS